MALGQHWTSLRENTVIRGLPNSGIATKIVVVLEENYGSVSLLPKNAVDGSGRIAKGAKLFLKSDNGRTSHAGVKTAIVWRLCLQLSCHAASFDAYRNDTPLPASAEYAP
jgi:hypothetical protein